ATRPRGEVRKSLRGSIAASSKKGSKQFLASGGRKAPGAHQGGPPLFAAVPAPRSPRRFKRLRRGGTSRQNPRATPRRRPRRPAQSSLSSDPAAALRAGQPGFRPSAV